MQQPAITLTIQRGPQRGQQFSVAKDSIVIGRMMGSDVVISDPGVSRRHASIIWERGQPVIRDLGSINGTFVNGVRITGPQALRDGDTIGLGRVQLGFQCPDLVEARPTVAMPALYQPVQALQRRPALAEARPTVARPTPPAEVERGPGGLSWMALGLLGLAVVILLVAAAVGAYFVARPGEEVAEVPTVVINSPPSGSRVAMGQEVVVQARATDSRGVTRVELLVNGVLYHSDVSPNPQGQSPFISRQSWQASAAGTYTLMVKAYNAAGGVSQPAAITVNVAGAATPGPGEPTATPTVTSTPAPGTPTATWTPEVVTETPTATPTGCILDAAFVANVTVPEGTVFEPGARITKFWRIRNSGSCPWESGSTWVFVSGDQMGAAASQAVRAIAAGANMDIGVTMYAPSAPGTYTGYWRMKSPDGQVFGQTCSVQIVVQAPATATPTVTPTPTATPTQPPPPTVVYDFMDHMCDGDWTSGAGSLLCPGGTGDNEGFVIAVGGMELEDGSTWPKALETHPRSVDDGWIQGKYLLPSPIQAGDRFVAKVGFLKNATAGNVKFMVTAGTNGGTTVCTHVKAYNNTLVDVSCQFDPIFVEASYVSLRVLAEGPSNQDWAVWVDPRIERP